jgi:hypothetical protein
MSKRFGRNQRRRLRAELANGAIELGQVNAAWALDQQLIRWQRGAIDRQTESLVCIAKMLGSHFIGLEPVSMDCGDTLPEQVRIRTRHRAIDMAGPTDLCDPMEMSLAAMEIASLKCTQVRTSIDAMRASTHIRVRTAIGEVGYAFSHGAFDRMPRKYAIQFLAQRLAAHLFTSREIGEVL